MQTTLITDFLKSKESELLQLLETIINIDSGTRNTAGVAQVVQVLQNTLNQYDIPNRTIEADGAGPVLIAEINTPSDEAPIVFIGHTDTVFPDGTAKANPFRIDDDGFAHGPGIVDMKSGVVIGLYSLLALQSLPHFTRPVKYIIVSDEENLHMFSNVKDIIRQEANGAVYGLNFETGHLDDSIVVGRKGGGIADITVTGRHAHSGNAPQDGRSAILEMAHKIIAIEQLNDYSRGKLLNCGKVIGGTGENVIPGSATVSIGIRFDTLAMRDEILADLESLCQQQTVPDTQTDLTVRMEIDCMEASQEVMALYDAYAETAQQIGYGQLTAIKVNGASDSGILTSLGIPTLCGLGGMGDGAHTAEEIALVSSFVKRAILSTAFVSSYQA
ncbi:M20/M25/M40 family metallo-hydrolase [Streptococcus moroccensis]|uniref:Glutamate carboxypeptidase n=1 Tax=Streptococcus moroccensis TaxID=1451356 RepID=A0ABT9YUG3_9STRE|nr:M20/M25/M40 family metallo-hydrolase [Streptococcus moroccensis]MDQ0223237.1 glutamate carboxypeptidase [Streptococcus moroccensis]